MNSKALCNLSMFFALIIAIESIAVFFPQLNVFLMILSWAVSAIYLELLPFTTWAKVRLMLEASKLPRYYEAVIRTNAIGATSNKMLSIAYAIDPDIQDELIMDKLMFENAGWWVPVIALVITYGSIFIIHRHLVKQGFFRRLMI